MRKELIDAGLDPKSVSHIRHKSWLGRLWDVGCLTKIIVIVIVAAMAEILVWYAISFLSEQNTTQSVIILAIIVFSGFIRLLIRKRARNKEIEKALIEQACKLIEEEKASDTQFQEHIEKINESYSSIADKQLAVLGNIASEIRNNDQAYNNYLGKFMELEKATNSMTGELKP